MAIQDEYKKIDDSFKTGYETISNKELVWKHGRRSTSSAEENIQLEMNRRLIDEIQEFNISSSKQSDKMIKLTGWIKWLTIAMLIGLAIQIGLLPFSQ